MYKGFLAVVRKGQAMELINTTDDPFSWFPELKQVFKNFDIKNMTIEVETENPDLARKIFQIRKVEENAKVED